MLCGLDWLATHAAALNIKVANMSIGGPGTSDGNCGLTDGDAFHAAFCRARDAGVTMASSL
jgi:subtilisin